MPPLRLRDGDLIRFAEHYEKFFAEQCARNFEGLSSEAVACIRAYAWPGNLRELRNAIERAVILAKRETLSPEDFPAELRGQNAATIASAGKSAASWLVDFAGKTRRSASAQNPRTNPQPDGSGGNSGH